MNCETYLSMLATLPIDAVTHGDARAHAATCRDCDRVSRVIAERERNMLMAFDELYAPTPAAPFAARTLAVARRRRVAIFSRVGLGLAAAGMLLFALVSRTVAPASGARVQETFRLQCLSPEQAMEVIRASGTSRSVSVYARVSPLGVIDVAAPPAEMVRVRALVEVYDNPAASQCGVQLTVPKVIKSP